MRPFSRKKQRGHCSHWEVGVSQNRGPIAGGFKRKTKRNQPPGVPKRSYMGIFVERGSPSQETKRKPQEPPRF